MPRFCGKAKRLAWTLFCGPQSNSRDLEIVPERKPNGNTTERLARQALAAAPARATYARIDIVPDDEGVLRIMELELIEPALFLDHAPDAGAAFTQAMLSGAQIATA